MAGWQHTRTCSTLYLCVAIFKVIAPLFNLHNAHGFVAYWIFLKVSTVYYCLWQILMQYCCSSFSVILKKCKFEGWSLYTLTLMLIARYWHYLRAGIKCMHSYYCPLLLSTWGHPLRMICFPEKKKVRYVLDIPHNNYFTIWKNCTSLLYCHISCTTPPLLLFLFLKCVLGTYKLKILRKMVAGFVFTLQHLLFVVNFVLIDLICKWNAASVLFYIFIYFKKLPSPGNNEPACIKIFNTRSWPIWLMELKI